MLELETQRQMVDWSQLVGCCLQLENIKRKISKSSSKIAKIETISFRLHDRWFDPRRSIV